MDARMCVCYINPACRLHTEQRPRVSHSSHLHHQAPRRQILRHLGTVVTAPEHRRVVVHVCHVNDDCGDVTERRLPAAPLHRQVVLPRNLEIQRGHEGHEACKKGNSWFDPVL